MIGHILAGFTSMSVYYGATGASPELPDGIQWTKIHRKLGLLASCGATFFLTAALTLTLKLTDSINSEK
jgi:hypothetical protein